MRLVDHLFRVPHPEDVPEGTDFLAHLNPDSLRVLADCALEPGLAAWPAGTPVQFERHGYFTLDAKRARPGKPVFLRSVALRDTWAKLEQKDAGKKG